jgi:hypothetical protein
MASFEEAWVAVAVARDGEIVSSELREFVRGVYSDLQPEAVDLAALRKDLLSLLEFLSGEGRTNANCWAFDLFFGICRHWERDWGDHYLPEKLHDVLAKMGEALHDTVRDAQIAENFGCLPEQLLRELESFELR